MNLHSLVFVALLAGCIGGGDKPGTGTGQTTVDALDRTTQQDSNQTPNQDAGRDTFDTGKRKTYPSGG